MLESPQENSNSVPLSSSLSPAEIIRTNQNQNLDLLARAGLSALTEGGSGSYPRSLGREDRSGEAQADGALYVLRRGRGEREARGSIPPQAEKIGKYASRGRESGKQRGNHVLTAPCEMGADGWCRSELPSCTLRSFSKL